MEERSDFETQTINDSNRSAESALETGSTIAVGMSEYEAGVDESVLEVFSRADGIMYENKAAMKQTKKANVTE